MSRRILITTMLALACSAPGWAALTNGRAAPARNTISVAQAGGTFPVTWLINTDAVHTLGAVSAVASFVNAATGAEVAPPLRVTVGSPAGTGPLSFLESITISGAQVETWRAQGIRVIGYRRTFTAPGSAPVTAQWLLQIRGAGLEGSREAAGDLAIQRMDLEFLGGRRVAVVERNSALTARVRIAYSGSGVLRGRWEVAEPGSRDADLFRVLSLIREPVPGGLPVTLDSPRLPTGASGRYVLRFCVEAGADTCASSATAVQTFYEILPGEAVRALRGLAPDRQALRAGDRFHWPSVPAAAIYQIQIFLPAAPPEREPRFVTGLLLPGAGNDAAPSPLVREKLLEGRAYLWRVTAHDADGELIARSELLPFTWQP